MCGEKMMCAMKMVFTQEDMNRLSIKENAKIGVYMEADVHGMNRREAERFISNVISINRSGFTLGIIHGYNHGTVLKEMVMEKKFSKRVVDRYCPEKNPGKTLLMIE